MFSRLMNWHEDDTTVKEQPDESIIRRNKLGSLLLGYHPKTDPSKSTFEC